MFDNDLLSVVSTVILIVYIGIPLILYLHSFSLSPSDSTLSTSSTLLRGSSPRLSYTVII